MIPEDANIRWYGFRSWIECSYRDVKSDGWLWHKTRLRQPDRAERHWLAQSQRLRSSSNDDWRSFASRAIAMLWMVTLGGEQEISSNEKLIGDRASPSESTPTRQISCFLNGLLTVVARLRLGSVYRFWSLVSFTLQLQRAIQLFLILFNCKKPTLVRPPAGSVLTGLKQF